MLPEWVKAALTLDGLTMSKRIQGDTPPSEAQGEEEVTAYHGGVQCKHPDCDRWGNPLTHLCWYHLNFSDDGEE